MPFLLFIFLLFLAPDSFAADSIFSLDPSDKAQQMLSNIFGGNIGPLQLYGSSSNPILSSMFQRLNNIVITIGVLVISYIGVLSTVNTAHEGEAMGKKWSSIWIPLKAIFGMLLMIPTPTSGYSLIQVAVMWVVLQGVGAANSIWAVVLDQMATGTSISGNIIPDVDQQQLSKLAIQVLDASVCQAFLNQYTPAVNTIKNDLYIALSKSPNTATTSPSFQMGAASNPTVCGQFIIQAKDDNGYAAKTEGLEQMFMSLAPIANELGAAMAKNPSGDTDTVIGPSLLKIQTALTNAIALYMNSMTVLAAQVPPDNSRAGIIAASRKDGIAYVGNFYFTLAGTGVGSNKDTATLPQVSTTDYPPNDDKFSTNTQKDIPSGSLPYTALQSLLISVNTQAKTALNLINAAVENTGTPNMDQFGSSFAAFTGLQQKFQFLFTASEKESEPLLSIAKFGSTLMTNAETILFATITGGILLTALAFCGAQAPTPSMFTTIAMMLFLLISAICMALWTLGASLALFLPMVPYMIYTVTFLGWLVSVIEAMIAAPILALGLITPGGEELGKAMHGIMILTNVCLKPMLMVFGFILASRLLKVIITMINASFSPALASLSTAGVSLSPIFGWIAALVLYTGFILSITNKCFSLIYIIPNKILRWIGSQGDDFGEEGVVSQAKQSYEQGSGEVAKVAGGALKESGSALAKKMSKGKSDEDKDGGGESEAQEGGSGSAAAE